jgi:L-serine dehydratase
VTAPAGSVLDLFQIGVGPSSSHTVGPMRAAREFVRQLAAAGGLDRVARVEVVLCGSLGATGIGHGTPDAVLAGLAGLDPATCDPDEVRGRWGALAAEGRLALAGGLEIAGVRDDVRLAPLERMPAHPNGMRFSARDAEGAIVEEGAWYSVGGGRIVEAASMDAADRDARGVDGGHPFADAAELLDRCDAAGASIEAVVRGHEVALRGGGAQAHAALDAELDRIWTAMSGCVDRGLASGGELPGGLRVRRRAAAQRARLEGLDAAGAETSIEWLQAFAMAVNEENAVGGRVVTAPTNGAAGIIPAVGRHWLRTSGAGAAAGELRRYLLTAGAIGAIIRRNASISGAEAGCQGEVGSACAMAAAGFCALLGGTPRQIENAAEIAMEHHLGLTCDPVGGLVQVPCIERNAVASVTAVSAARLAMQGDGTHLVPLDTVIETMRRTGLDMSDRYKETSLGGLAVTVGLAVNVVEC